MANMLEAKARRLWEASGHNPELVAEVVGIGFEDPIDETITWYELQNTAVAGEFRVEPEDLERVLKYARSTGYHDPAGLVYLWHSHYIAEEPSDVDIQNFPSWLCDAGLVYHAPSGGTSIYNADGVLQMPVHGDNFAKEQNSDSARDNQEVGYGRG